MKSQNVRGAELFYKERGDGLPLLLVHGFPLDHTMWAGQIEGLAPSCRVVAPDLRGFGRSAQTESKYTMEQFADDLAGLLDAIGIDVPVVLCGLSMGGYVALQFWRKYPRRLRGLILCDTRAGADSPEAAAARMAAAERVLREGAAPLIETMLPKLFAESTRRKRPEIVESQRRVIGAGDPRGIAAAARGMAKRPDMTASLGRIACPTLVLAGQSDVITPPAEMRAMAEAIPGARMIEIPDAGHMAPLENPAAVNAAIAEFLGL